MSKRKTKKPDSQMDLVITPTSARFEKTPEKRAADRAEDAYERPGDLYRTIADAGGLGWLHLPTQDKWEEMQMKAFKRGVEAAKARKDETE